MYNLINGLAVKSNWSPYLMWRVSKRAILTILDMSRKEHVDVYCHKSCLLTHKTVEKLPRCKTPMEDHQTCVGIFISI
jgi:hypothetical protein